MDAHKQRVIAVLDEHSVAKVDTARKYQPTESEFEAARTMLRAPVHTARL
jgi:hypothetical protein